MPLIEEIEVNAGTRLGIWKITEEPEELKWQLQWGAEDIKKYSSYNDPERSMHWLASRVLLRKMVNVKSFIEVAEDEYGKPFLANLPYIMSISHSKKMVAVMLSHDQCGVDVQLIEQKVFKVASKFISSKEMEFMLGEENAMEQYTVMWCAKEAMYKLYGKRKLDFTRDLIVYPFEYVNSGMLRGRIEKDDFMKEVMVKFKKVENYILAYTVGNF